jgi:hypothetical protein
VRPEPVNGIGGGGSANGANTSVLFKAEGKK